MPYADPEKRIQNSKRWRDEKIKEGYGKALYARRAQRYRNEEILRQAVLDAITYLHLGDAQAALDELETKLAEAPPIKKPIEYMPERRPDETN